MWKGGGDTFFNKGTNGRWRDEITPENLALYDQAADRALSPECRQWIENAGPMANDGA
jgi:aryl sulfotransferase